MKVQKCHDCGIVEGQIHEYGCDMERCPICGRQLIACSCCYTFLNLDISEGSWTYVHGLTVQQSERWVAELERIGRVPYFLYPNICIRCGKLWPDMFKVSNERWQKAVEPLLRREMLCEPCFLQMEAAIALAEKEE